MLKQPLLTEYERKPVTWPFLNARGEEWGHMEYSVYYTIFAAKDNPKFEF